MSKELGDIGNFFAGFIVGIIAMMIVVLFVFSQSALGHDELRNDMPVVPQGLTYCFMRYDSKDSGEKDTYLECNMVEGFTQEQLRGMRDTLEDLAEK